MARILYGVAGEGNGHAIRAKILIDELKKDHSLTVFSYGKNFRTLKGFYSEKKQKKTPKNPQLERILGSYMYYINNTVSASITGLVNFCKLPFMILASLKYIPHFLKKPDIVITDFEPFVCWWARIFNVPVISVDNQHAITHTKIDWIKGQFLYELYSKVLVYLFVPFKTKIIISSFFETPIIKKNTTVVAPIIKEEIIAQKPQNKGHILVYQTSASYKHLIKILKKVDKKFIVYGFNKKGQEKNCIFKTFNNDAFHKDIATADAVIINGGFTVLSEALYLNKPIFSIPIKKQFEQILNGHYINKCGYGAAVKDITIENFNAFLQNKETYRKNIKKRKWDKNKAFFSLLNKTIKQYSKDRNKDKKQYKQ